MTDTPAFSHTADGLLRILVRRGEIMTDVVLVYRDIDGEICWYGSDSLTKSDAVIMLETVKQALISAS